MLLRALADCKSVADQSVAVRLWMSSALGTTSLRTMLGPDEPGSGSCVSGVDMYIEGSDEGHQRSESNQVAACFQFQE
jgi:hypothetical protein